MNQDILEVVDELFRRGLQVSEIDIDVPLVDYGLDSIRSINMVVDMESAFGVRISDEQAASMETLRDVVDQVTALVTVRAGQGEGDA
ncbi:MULTISPECIES: acyl carrier protein [Streptomyces]|uniref:Acyl carrier protein n=1 Tax=Streptomyces halstedii TaxID=1944 RepID=A0A6N9U188_STRHA|nr:MULTISPECIES: acyl carrier protein [Streptomyces]AWL41128.1 acyl carrier protein [Streptomyces sp. SM18]MBV7671614.1 acyl carrier protein [Streptomyces halstedii]NEA16529.1 acyl carrier protein [Streptomyces halstedii]